MNISALLEQLANNTHHRINIDNLINNQPENIREAFQTNNAATLKNSFQDNNISADRSVVVLIRK